jgi:hypothetical protein
MKLSCMPANCSGLGGDLPSITHAAKGGPIDRAVPSGGDGAPIHRVHLAKMTSFSTCLSSRSAFTGCAHSTQIAHLSGQFITGFIPHRILEHPSLLAKLEARDANNPEIQIGAAEGGFIGAQR